MNVGEGQRDELFREGQLEKKRRDKLRKNGTRCAVLYTEDGKSTLIMVRKINSNVCVM